MEATNAASSFTSKPCTSSMRRRLLTSAETVPGVSETTLVNKVMTKSLSVSSGTSTKAGRNLLGELSTNLATAKLASTISTCTRTTKRSSSQGRTIGGRGWVNRTVNNGINQAKNNPSSICPAAKSLTNSSHKPHSTSVNIGLGNQRFMASPRLLRCHPAPHQGNPERRQADWQ